MADKETLFRMCRNGETENVRMALSRGEDFKGVDKSGASAVTVAASRGHLDAGWQGLAGFRVPQQNPSGLS